jgi:hypothetical protein
MGLFRKTKSPESSVEEFNDSLNSIRKAQKNYLAKVGIDVDDRPNGVLPQLRKIPTKKKTSPGSIFRDE